ncbi:TetR/AcrR family transcriptional regulator [Romboutsia sp.]|uniref:TetR/AcrR family transcriptional regulator n=1 Tax=Romboutsia sp. TaxID=1965302 RepID=UPI003F30D34E
MPKIYCDEKREEIKNKLMDTGLELIKQYGMKKMSIESITKQIGIAQGTFYSFYKSKEILIYHISIRYQEKKNLQINELIKIKGHLDRSDIKEFYHGMILKDGDNVYRYLSSEEVQTFITRLPKDYLLKMSNVKDEMKKKLTYLKNKKEDCDLDAVINWIQIMNLAVENKNLLVESKFEKVINQMLENMLNEIFN